MRKLILIIFISLMWNSNSFTGGHLDFSIIKGDYKAKCITEDKSWIDTVTINFDEKNKPNTTLNNRSAVLVSMPPFTESFEIISHQNFADGFWRYGLKYDSTFLRGQTWNGFVKTKSSFIEGRELRSPVDCVVIENTLIVKKISQKNNLSEKNNNSNGTFKDILRKYLGK